MNLFDRLFGKKLPRFYLVEIYVNGDPKPISWLTANPQFPELGSKMNGKPIIKCTSTPVS